VARFSGLTAKNIWAASSEAAFFIARLLRVFVVRSADFRRLTPIARQQKNRFIFYLDT
jgi:hypothetical protein